MENTGKRLELDVYRNPRTNCTSRAQLQHHHSADAVRSAATLPRAYTQVTQQDFMVSNAVSGVLGTASFALHLDRVVEGHPPVPISED